MTLLDTLCGYSRNTGGATGGLVSFLESAADFEWVERVRGFYSARTPEYFVRNGDDATEYLFPQGCS